MTNAEVARLAVQLDLTGNFTSALGGAEAKAVSFGSKITGALGHASGQIKNLLLGPLGLFGLGAGLVTLGGGIEKGIGKASEFAFAIEKLQGLTSDSADSLSQLIAVTDNYGISADRLVKVVGFTQKTLGLLATNADAAATFSKEFGFSITDAQGKVLPFNTILEKAADYYNSNRTEAEKAALAAKLFGRNYTDLVPVLKLGAKGIQDAEQAAKDLGITLTQDNVRDLAAFRDATREAGDALSGLELQIGLQLVPALKDLALAATHFISDHRTDIATFFKNVVSVGRTAVGVIADLAGTVNSFWQSIPSEVRDFLTKGLIADRTVKFLFGFSPVESAASGIFGHFLARGSSPANPMFVSAGLGGLGGAGGGLGLGGLLTVGLSVATIAALAFAFASAMNVTPDPTNRGGSAAGRGGAFGPRGQHGTRGDMDGITAIQNAGDQWAQEAHELTATMTAGDKWMRDNTFALAALKGQLVTFGGNLANWRHMTADAILAGVVARSAATHGGTALGPGDVRATFDRDMLRIANRVATSGETQKQKLSDLDRIMADVRAHGDRATRRKVEALITAVKHQKPPTVNVSVHSSTSISVSDVRRAVYRYGSYSTSTIHENL